MCVYWQDSAFLTEVHHIAGDGKDAGVVYCEMQDKENTGECMTYNKFLRAMYPGVCGYKSITGGIEISSYTYISYTEIYSRFVHFKYSSFS